MVPLVSAFLAGDLMAIPVRTWIACVVAFAGVLVMGFDGQETSVALDPSDILPSISSVVHAFSGGDLLIVLAAFAYTMHVVRLGRYAQFTTPLKLAASKATVEATFSVVLVSGLVLFGNGVGTTDVSGVMSYANEMGTEITTFFSTLQEGISSGSIPNSVLLSAGGACIWTGLVTCAYTIYAQSFGQRRVNPTDANLIYSTQPLFSALFAWGLLGETLGTTGYVGGGLIASALWLITSGDDDPVESKTV
jgi:drug/metabolite transporter (DMT)-like permease